MKIEKKLPIKKSGFIWTVYAHVRHFMKKSYKDNTSAMAGHSTFFLLLSAIPMLMFAFALLSLLTGKDIEVSDFLEYGDISRYPYLVNLLEYIIDSVHKANSGVIIITAVVTLWSAGRGMYCITDGVMRIYKIPNKKIWLIRRVYAMGYTVALMFVFLLSIVFVGFNILMIGTVVKLSGENQFLRVVMQVLMFIVFAFFQAFVLSIALKLYLRKKVRNDSYRTIRALFPGMFLAVAAWNGLTIGMIFYVRHFATSSVYGSLASVFMLMIWVYFMMLILLYGVQLNYIYRRRFSGKWFRRRGKKTVSADSEPKAEISENITE